MPLRPQKLLGILFCLALASSGWALPFGQNKVRRKDFRWQILTTPHFEVYYYPEEESLARQAALMAEKAYLHDASALDYYPKTRNPLFVYQDHVEFEQTNVSQEILTEGVGGFTEPFKNRIVFPTSGSDRWLKTVITHEFTHAIQFDILYGEGARSFQVLKNYVIPLWMIEGMAEYCAQDWDTYADTIVRDAVFNDRITPLWLMDGFEHLDNVFLAYKLGQSAIQFLSDRFGPDKVALLIKKFKAQLSTDQVLKDVTGMGLGEFNREWTAALKQRYWIQSSGRDAASRFGTSLTAAWDGCVGSSNGAAWSPDGNRIAYVTTRRGREEIWEMDASGRRARPLFAGPYEAIGRSGDIGVPGNRLAWSPDGKTLAFVITDQAKRWMVLKGLQDGHERRTQFGFEDLAAPAFSPDGRQLAFAGTRHGKSGLYAADLQSGEVKPLVEPDGLSLLADPCWFPDGSRLVFSAEEEGHTRLFSVAVDGTGLKALTPAGFNSRQPALADNGNKLFYCSDQAGIYDLMEADSDGSHAKAFTHVSTGLFFPKPSPDGSKLLFIAYEDGCEALYTRVSPVLEDKPLEAELRTLVNPYELLPPPPAASMARRRKVEAPPSVTETAGTDASVPGVLAEPSGTTMEAKDFPSRPYRLKISPDLFFVLMGYDSAAGPVGGGYLTASDMLGEHNLTLYADFVPGYQSIVQAQYLLLHGPVDLSTSLFYNSTSYPYYNAFVPNYSLPVFLQQEVGGSLIASHPFTRYTRLEGGLSLTRLYTDIGDPTVLPITVQSLLGSNVLDTLFLSLVHDTTTYHAYEPLGGVRWNVGGSFTDRWMGSTKNFVLSQAEAQWFQPLDFISRDTVLSLRVLGVDQTGVDRELFYFGGFQVRGLDYGEYLVEKFAVGNIEIRRPFLQGIDVALWPLDFLLIKDLHLALFYDTGVGVETSDWMDLRAEDVRGAYGGGLRMHTFLAERGLVTWRFDIAHRVDRGPTPDRPDNTRYFFSLGTIF
jgi:Tol biopolymer transport system component